jgi:hypothetical protein
MVASAAFLRRIASSEALVVSGARAFGCSEGAGVAAAEQPPTTSATPAIIRKKVTAI